jgi:hypothetical protein
MKKKDKNISRSILIYSIISGLVVLNSLLLCRVGVDLFLQILILLSIAGFAVCGMLLLGENLSLIPDSIIGLTVSASTGIIVFCGFNFLLLHIDNRSLWIPANYAFFSLILIAGIVFRKRLTYSSHSVRLSGKNIILIILISLLLALTTGYGFLNNPGGKASQNRIISWSFIYQTDEEVPNWGWNKDKRYWLGAFIETIEKDGLPEDVMLHNGIQVFYLSLSRLLSSSPLPVTRAYKATVAIFYFCLLYSFAYVGRRFFNLGKSATMLLIISVPFFAAINYPFYPFGRSSYLGFFPAGGSFFHSITQFMSLVIGMGGIILILEGRKRSGLSLWGCLLAAAAFFFKPSFFAVTALPLGCFLWFNRNEILRSKILGSVILLFPPIFWTVYPAIHHISKLEAPMAYDPFRVMFHYSFRHFQPAIYSNDFLFASLLVLLSFAVFIPIGFDYLSSWRHREFQRFFRNWHQHLPALFFTSTFLLGVFSYGLLVQDSPQMFHANLSWGAGIGYLLFLPVLVKMISRMKYTGWKIAAGILFALHLWGGIYHLYRFTVMGKIY